MGKPGDPALHHAHHPAAGEIGAAEILRRGDSLGVQQALQPLAAGEPLQVGGGLGLGQGASHAIVAIVGVTAGAPVREETGALRKGIGAQQCQGPVRGDAATRPGQLHGARRVGLGVGLGEDEVGVGAVLCVCEPCQERDAGEDSPGQAQVEAVPQAPPSREGHQRDQRDDQPGNHDRANDLGARGEVLQPLEQEHEVPFGPRCSVRLGSVRGGSQRRPPGADHEVEHGCHHREAGDGITQGLIGPEPAVARSGRVRVRPVLPIPLHTCRLCSVPAVARLARRNPVPPEQVNVSRDQGDQGARQHARVEREEARQGEVAVVRAADQDLLHRRAHHGRDRCDARGNLGRPVPLLVPRQQVARQRQPQHDVQQDDAEPEVDLAGGLVRARHDHLHEVQDEQDHGGVGHVVVDTAEHPAAGHHVLDVVDALPGALRIGTVRGPEDHAGHKLHGDREGQRAAPHIAPLRTAGDRFDEGLAEHRPIPRPVVEPAEKRIHAAGVLSARPGRKFWNRTQTWSPSRISTSSVSMSRGLGLEGSSTAPSRSKLLLWQGHTNRD